MVTSPAAPERRYLSAVLARPGLTDRRAEMDSWPRQDFLELSTLPSAVPCARQHARHVLRTWDLGRLAEPVELVVSELLTNAITAARAVDPGIPVRLWLRSAGASVLILAWDPGPGSPAARPADPGAESGRGLLLVEAVSTRWGWYVPDLRTGKAGHAGKVVWAVVG
jgi:anti-sigma regulatory factor (Ser/Thr protein kinase)